MLRALSIRDILLIERLELTLTPGLNVLTGETGAGKSILLDCLGLVLGWRGRADLVRAGAELGEVSAEFEIGPDHPAWAVLEEAGHGRDDTLILRRIVRPDGRKQGYVNDRRVSGGLLQALSATLVELHGQRDERGLLDIQTHRDLLDRFGATDAGPVRAAWQARHRCRRALEQAQTEAEAAARDADYLRHAVAELDAFGPEAGEDDQLDAKRRALQAAHKIGEDVIRATQDMGAASGLVADALRRLERAAGPAEGALDDALAGLAQALDMVSDAEGEVARANDRLDRDPAALETCEERLFALRALARKHSVQPDDLAEYAEKLTARLRLVDAAAAELGPLAEAVRAADAAYETAASGLSAARAAAAAALDAAMAEELPPLKLERAQFVTRLAKADPGPTGHDQVQFEAATNPGTPPGLLGKVASGGELSRFLLALKVCLAGTDPVTMIFDEIDQGVGGATADAVGRRLARLAASGQLLVVTHAPQVAARADHHLLVQKTAQDDTARTSLVALDHAARVAELARMLAGERITPAARAAAEALLTDR